MSKIAVTWEFGSPQEAANFLLSLPPGATAQGTAAGSGQPAAPTLTTISPSSPPPPGVGGMQMGNPPPGVAPPPPAPAALPPAMAAAPPPAPPPSAPPPAPPPAPASPPAGGLHAEVVQAMQEWAKAGHKAAGIKRVLTKAGVPAVSATTPQNVLEWLRYYFKPKADGSYWTPEEIEAL